MKAAKVILKIGLAGITAVAILCLLFSCYSVDPVHIENPDGVSDYKWPAHSPWRKMQEGISWGRFDENGYNNLQVVENPDVVILGSSHMEATNVCQEESTAAQLAALLRDQFSVYNMGISGHHFLKVCKYLPNTLSFYEAAPQVVVIETSGVFFSWEDVNALLEGRVDYTPSHSDGLIAMLQKLPFLRQVYRQLDSGLLDLLLPEKSAQTNPAPAAASVPALEEDAYDALFSYLRETMEGYDTQLVIFYHSPGDLQEDGSIHFPGGEEVALFARKCEENGIVFLDMRDAFLDAYHRDHIVPYGFVTGKISAGHLNAQGHKLIARELAAAITGWKEGTLCR